jgi:serine protease Do
MVGETPIGKEVPIVVWRNGKKEKLNITIGERPDENVVAAAPTRRSDAWLGLYVDEVDSRQARGRFSTDRGQTGVIVLDVEEGSPADEAGIREGDVITEVYSQEVNNLDEYMKIAKKLEERKDPIAFLVKRGRSTTYIPVTPGKR